MPRFRVIVTGRNVVIPDEGGGDTCTAFATTRFVHAATEQEARGRALELVRAAWHKEPFSAASPVPLLGIAFSRRVLSPLKRSRPNAGWCFATSEESLSEAVQIEKEASAGWFL
jgi:hypothetical protein